MDAVVDRYFPVVDALETELDTIEGQIFDRGAGRANIERLYDLKHKVTTLRHAISPLMDASAKLHGGRVPAVCAASIDYFRDVTDHLSRLQTSIDTIRDTIGTAIQVNLSMVTIEESEVTKRLAAWAGIFAVATFFVGVWGMNFKHMPELEKPWGYPVALTFIVSICSLMWWRFRRAGWVCLAKRNSQALVYLPVLLATGSFSATRKWSSSAAAIALLKRRFTSLIMPPR